MDSFLLSGENGCFALDYDPIDHCVYTAFDLFAFDCYDQDYRYLRTTDCVDRSSLTAQGIFTDGTYLYFILYDQSSFENCIFVFRKDGTYLTRIEVPFKREEPENIAIIGDTIYIGCNNSSWTAGNVYAAKLIEK